MLDRLKAKLLAVTPKKFAIVLGWLLLWELADRLINNRIVLSGPLHIAASLVGQLGQSEFWLICAASFLRIVLGFLLSFVVGFVLAVLAYRFSVVKDLLEPLISALKIVPMISIVIMLLIWVGNQALTIYLSFMIVLPLIYTSMLMGLESVTPSMLEMANYYKLSAWKKFLYVYRPAFMPFIISSCRTAIGLSWKSGIMAEVIGTPKPSIGREMYAAKSYLQTADLFAWTIVVIVLSVIFEWGFMYLIQKLGQPMGGFLDTEQKLNGKGRKAEGLPQQETEEEAKPTMAGGTI